MANVPQMQTHAPIGPWNPQNRTMVPRSAPARPAAAANVVRRTSQPQASPTTIAAAYSTMCGGVQKVSRPTLRCQAMSQMIPICVRDAAATRARRTAVTAVLVSTGCAAMDVGMGRAEVAGNVTAMRILLVSGEDRPLEETRQRPRTWLTVWQTGP